MRRLVVAKSTTGTTNGVWRLPPERPSDPEWMNIRRHDIQERWNPRIAPWVVAEHRARMEHALRVIPDYVLPPGRVIDVGCAQGTLGILLSQAGYRVTLVDVRKSHIEYARERYAARSEMSYCVGLVPEVPSENDFDVAICTEVIEHMPNARALLAGLREKCRVGGIVYLTTPNGCYGLSRLPTYSAVSEAVLAGMERNSDDGDDHRFAYTLSELVAAIRTEGFAICEAGAFLPFWTVGYGKSKTYHRAHLRFLGRPLGSRVRRRAASTIAQAKATSLYVVAERSA